MAKAEYVLYGNFDEIVGYVQQGVLAGSSSASYEDGSDIVAEDVRCAVRVFERYSWTGGNRVSLAVTMMGYNGAVYLSAIASGGSTALMTKINTMGETAFLDTLANVALAWQRWTAQQAGQPGATPPR